MSRSPHYPSKSLKSLAGRDLSRSRLDPQNLLCLRFMYKFFECVLDTSGVELKIKVNIRSFVEGRSWTQDSWKEVSDPSSNWNSHNLITLWRCRQPVPTEETREVEGGGVGSWSQRGDWWRMSSHRFSHQDFRSRRSFRVGTMALVTHGRYTEQSIKL